MEKDKKIKDIEDMSELLMDIQHKIAKEIIVELAKNSRIFQTKDQVDIVVYKSIHMPLDSILKNIANDLPSYTKQVMKASAKKIKIKESSNTMQ